MANMFKKDSLKFDGTNYDSWKENMKTYLLYMGPRYWILKKLVKKRIWKVAPRKKEIFSCVT